MNYNKKCCCPNNSIPKIPLFKDLTYNYNEFSKYLMESKHPLDPLDSSEVQVCVQSVKSHPLFMQHYVFTSIHVLEPEKSFVLQYKKNEAFYRIGQILLYIPEKHKTIEALVDLGNSEKKVIKFEEVDILPPMNTENPPIKSFEKDELIDLLMENSDINKALAKRNLSTEMLKSKELGIFDMPFEVCLGLGYRAPEILPPDAKDKRIFPIVFQKNQNDLVGGESLDSLYEILDDVLCWIDGLIILLDATNKKVYKVIDEKVYELPKLVEDDIQPIRHPNKLNQLVHSQPNGPSFTFENNVVKWDNWSFRISWHDRTGIQLFNIKYCDNDVDRSVLYKLNLSEAGVVYNVKESPILLRNFFSDDSTRYPFLCRLIELQKGLDVPQYASLNDISIIDRNGNEKVKKSAFAIYEEDTNVLYRGRSLEKEGSGCRGQSLCIRYTFAGLIYQWQQTYVFNLDGSIDILQDVYGRDLYMISQDCNETRFKISKNRSASTHTHYFNYRMDFMVDGQKNRLVKKYQKQLSVKNNNQILLHNETVKTEKQAVQNMKPNTLYKIVNHHKKNRLGHHVGYKLLPLFDTQFNYTPIGSWASQLSSLNNHLHVTKYRENEQYAFGSYPNMQLYDIGLGDYIKKDESIVDEDIVLWYTMFNFHVPHPEDFPFTQAVRVGFSIRPDNFFEVSPYMNINARLG